MDLKKIKHLLGESVQPTKLGQKIMDVNSATWEKNGWTHGGMVNKDVLKKALQPYAAKFTKKDYDYLEDENFHSANEALLDLIGTKYEDLKEEVVAEVEMTRPDNKGLQLKANPARAFPPQTVKKAEDELIKDGLTKEQVHGLMNILFGMMEADTALNDVKQVTPEKMGAIRKMLPNLDEKKIRELMAVVFGMMREDKEEKDVKDLEKFIDN